jgi:hypothetical protein
MYAVLHGSSRAGKSLAVMNALAGRRGVVYVALDEASVSEVASRVAESTNFYGGAFGGTPVSLHDVLAAFEDASEMFYRRYKMKTCVVVENIHKCVEHHQGTGSGVGLGSSGRRLHQGAAELASALVRLYNHSVVNAVYTVSDFSAATLLWGVSGQGCLTPVAFSSIVDDVLARQLANMQCLCHSSAGDDVVRLTEFRFVSERVEQQSDDESSYSAAAADDAVLGSDQCPVGVPDDVPLSPDDCWRFVLANRDKARANAEFIASRISAHMGDLNSVLFALVERKVSVREAVESTIRVASSRLASALVGRPESTPPHVDRATFILLTHILVHALCTPEPDMGHPSATVRFLSVAHRGAASMLGPLAARITSADIIATVDQLVTLKIVSSIDPFHVRLSVRRNRFLYNDFLRDDPDIVDVLAEAQKTIIYASQRPQNFDEATQLHQQLVSTLRRQQQHQQPK